MPKFVLMLFVFLCRITENNRKEINAMFEAVNYETVCDQLKALTEGIPYEVANLANASALL